MSAVPWLRQRSGDRVAVAGCHNVELRAAWTVLFGASGTGKSTWLRVLAGLLPQRAGSLQIFGEEIRTYPAHRRRIALVEQSPALFPHLNVQKNVGFGSQRRGDEEAVLRAFQLGRLGHAAVTTLSGGERQRVAIARALASQPRALLLDEVFTGMDATLRTALIVELRRWQQRTQLPILSVTHDVAEAFATADEVLRMEGGEITAQGKVGEVLRDERERLLVQLGEASL